MVLSLTACGGSESANTSDDVIKIGVMQFGEFTALQNCYDGFVQGLALIFEHSLYLKKMVIYYDYLQVLIFHFFRCQY